MDRTACTEPQCLYKDTLYLYFTLGYYVPVQQLWSGQLTQSNSIYSPYQNNSVIIYCSRKAVHTPLTTYNNHMTRHELSTQLQPFCADERKWTAVTGNIYKGRLVGIESLPVLKPVFR